MDGGCQNNPNQVPEYGYPKGALLRFDRQSDLVEVYGNCYFDNLIGFDPITFNQRTEQYFDRPYSNVGVRAELRF